MRGEVLCARQDRIWTFDIACRIRVRLGAGGGRGGATGFRRGTRLVRMLSIYCVSVVRL